MIVKKCIQLNGKDNGVVVNIGRNSFFRTSKGDTRIFNNIEMAKAISNKYLNNVSSRRFSFIIGKNIIPLDDCQKIDDYYQYIEDDGTILNIYENKTTEVITAGYFIFDEGDVKRSDKTTYGIKRNKEILKYVRNESESIFLANIPNALIRNIYNLYKEYIICGRDSSVRIHVVTNSRLMDINQARKADNNKVLPFDKSMDKFTTLYVYVTKMLEDNSNEAKIKSDNIIQYMVEAFNNQYNDGKFTEINLEGRKIYVEEKI